MQQSIVKFYCFVVQTLSVSVRQSNKILRLIVAPSWVFYLSVCFASFPVLFVCICVLNYCHRVATPLQLNISYHTNQLTA